MTVMASHNPPVTMPTRITQVTMFFRYREKFPGFVSQANR